MNKLKLLIKKELLFIFRDTKSLISATIISIVLLPGIMFLLQTIQDFQRSNIESQEIVIGVNAMNQVIEIIEFLQSNKSLDLKFIESSNFEEDFKSGKIDGFINFSSVDKMKNIEYIYDQNSNISSGAMTFVDQGVKAYIETFRQNYLISQNVDLDEYNSINFSSTTLQQKNGVGEQSNLVLFLFPYFIFIALIQGAMQFAIELSAGEKERNTLATTLSLNVKTWQIALSKISVTLVMSLYTLILNLISIVLSFSLFPNAFSSGTPDSGTFVSSPTMFLNLFLILLPLSFLSSAIMILLGIYARSQKEAGIYASPILMIAIVIGLSAQAFDASTSIGIFAIPFLGHMAGIKLALLNVLSFHQILILSLSTMLLLAMLIFVIVKLFEIEEILFRA